MFRRPTEIESLFAHINIIRCIIYIYILREREVILDSFNWRNRSYSAALALDGFLGQANTAAAYP